MVKLYHGDCLEMIDALDDESVGLIVTSPPYNTGKEYESVSSLSSWLNFQRNVIAGCVRACKKNGSICWQTGNCIVDGEVVTLDSILYPVFKEFGLKQRNRIIWSFGHGLHCSKRFSGRYEAISWWTKSDDYVFNLDPVRVPQKYPGKKYFKGPKAGQLSCNPLGKNPGDVWDIPNVKHNHVEKTDHPCQFPIELAERLILSMTNPGDMVVDPFAGSGTTLCAAILNSRSAVGAEAMGAYYRIAERRVTQAIKGSLPRRKAVL